MNVQLHVTLCAHIPGLGSLPEADTWFYTAMRDVYLPLLRVLDDLAALQPKEASALLSLALAPSLVQAWDDPVRREAFAQSLAQEIESRARQVERLQGDPLEETAAFYLRRAKALYVDFNEQYQQDVMRAFLEHARRGVLELLPMVVGQVPLPMLATPQARRASVCMTRRWWEARAELPWGGLWLPGCAFDPSLSAMLGQEGVTHCVVGAQSLRGALARPARSFLAPLESDGVLFFARHPETTSLLRWSTEESAYRDVAAGQVLRGEAPWLAMDRRDQGLLQMPFGDSGAQVYRPGPARQMAREHAAAFLEHAVQQAQAVAGRLDFGSDHPSVVCAWPASVFGGAWFEGPVFLKELMRLSLEAGQVSPCAASPAGWARVQSASPGLGSWHEGYLGAWLDPSLAWTQRHTRGLERDLIAGLLGDELAGREGAVSDARKGRQDRAATLALREIFLLHGEDLAFALRHDVAGEVPYDVLTQGLERGQLLLRALRTKDGARPSRLLGAGEVRSQAFDAHLVRYADLLRDGERRKNSHR